MLEVRSLKVRLGGSIILDGLDFEVRKGERLGLIGPNGAGKTTLLEALAGLLPLAGGRIDRRTSLFYLPDGIAPWADLQAGEVLRAFQSLHQRDDTAMEGLIASLDLRPVLAKRVSTLSKGNRKRMLLALAFLTRADLLLLDEPFDGLDIHQASRAVELIRAEQASGRTLVLSIHELRQAERLCERFLLLVGGRMMAAGTLAELHAQTGTSGSLEEVFLALR